MNDGQTHYSVADGVATVTFDRPQARNAMTWAMYDGLRKACHSISHDPDVRVVLFRGAGHEAFVSGTDISQFVGYTADQGERYELQIATAMEIIEHLTKPTIAVVEGACTGGGLIIATSCDFRIAATNAKFGVPIARTLGNCISVVNTARLIAAFGVARVKRMLLLAELVGAEEAASCGFVHDLVAPEKVDEAVTSMVKRLKEHAPLTMLAAKEAVKRVTENKLPEDVDLVRICYGSNDFQEGITAFLSKRKPNWTGT